MGQRRFRSALAKPNGWRRSCTLAGDTGVDADDADASGMTGLASDEMMSCGFGGADTVAACPHGRSFRLNLQRRTRFPFRCDERPANHRFVALRPEARRCADERGAQQDGAGGDRRHRNTGMRSARHSLKNPLPAAVFSDDHHRGVTTSLEVLENHGVKVCCRA